MINTKNPNIFMEKTAKGIRFYTRNLIHGARVYEERLVKEKGIEYREWATNKSKIAAALAKNIQELCVKEGDYVLYLGAASGTTVSHISDIIGEKGLVFGIDISARVLRELYFLALKRKNIAPLLKDCNHPEEYSSRICECDFLVQDIAQKNQVEIFMKNLKFLKKGGNAFLAIKARSIDVTKKPKQIFEMVKRELEKNNLNIIDYKTLEPFEKDHCAFLIRKD